MGAGLEAVGDRPDLHEDRQAGAAMHVRAVDELIRTPRFYLIFTAANTRDTMVARTECQRAAAPCLRRAGSDREHADARCVRGPRRADP